MALVLALIGIIGIIIGLLYLLAAKSMPNMMVGHVHSGRHIIRAGVSILVGLAFIVGAWLTSRGGSAASST